MKRLVLLFIVAVAVFAALIEVGQRGFGPFVITNEAEQKLILQFGKVRKVTEPGLSLRIPLLEDVRTFERRLLYLNTEALPIQTKDEERIRVDNYVVWRIVDPKSFLASFPTGNVSAESQIDKVVRADVREVIGQHTLSEVLKDKRSEIMTAISRASRADLVDDGVEIVDVRINRTELPPNAEMSVYARMKTERERLARKYRAEGNEQARRIHAEADREARVIVANANRESQILRGRGDARSARIYAEAYEGYSEFYRFSRSLEAYRKTIDEKTTLVLSPNSEFFRYLVDVRGEAAPPTPAASPEPPASPE